MAFVLLRAQIVALASLAAVLGIVATSQSYAQSYPAKPVTLIVPFPAGAGIDVAARHLGERIREATGQPVVVENRAGAGGNIGAQAVARAPADGYTVLFGPNSTMAANLYLYKQLGFDPVRDFAAIGTVGRVVSMLLVNPETLNVATVAELTASLRRNPDKYAFGSGNESLRIAGELYLTAIGGKAVHVPYKGVPAAVNDLIGGRIAFSVVDLTSALPHVRSGKLRALGVTSSQRVPLAQSVPTLAEAGVDGYEFTGWYGVFVPAATPAAIVERLGMLVQAAVNAPVSQEFFAKIGLIPFPGDPAATRAFLASEIQRWERLVRMAGIEAQ